MRADVFLRLYRLLETLLEEKYARTPRTSSSVVMEFARDDDSLPVREALDFCRSLRNLLTHSAGPAGRPLVEPNPEAISMLESIIEFVRQPLLALAVATPVDKLLVTDPDARALPLMRVMDERGFTNVPVLDQGRFVGVFSVSTVFSFVSGSPGQPLDELTPVRRFRAYLPIDRHLSERFLVLPQDADYVDVKTAFERGAAHRHRLAAVLLTDDGTTNTPLRGMITPWDALGKVQGEGTLIEEKSQEPDPDTSKLT